MLSEVFSQVGCLHEEAARDDTSNGMYSWDTRSVGQSGDSSVCDTL